MFKFKKSEYELHREVQSIIGKTSIIAMSTLWDSQIEKDKWCKTPHKICTQKKKSLWTKLKGMAHPAFHHVENTVLQKI